MVDHGPAAYDAEDDYPAFCINAATAVVADQAAGVDALGIVLGGSGNGEQIAANKVKGVRAALAWNLDTAKLAREHNNANVVAVGGRQHTVEEATELIKAFLANRSATPSAMNAASARSPRTRPPARLPSKQPTWLAS